MNEHPLTEVRTLITNSADRLEACRAKLLFQMANRYERKGDVETALQIYSESVHPGARLRRIRTLERMKDHRRVY